MSEEMTRARAAQLVQIAVAKWEVETREPLSRTQISSLVERVSHLLACEFERLEAWRTYERLNAEVAKLLSNG